MIIIIDILIISLLICLFISGFNDNDPIMGLDKA